MHYRHDEKQRGGDRHISFSVQSACLSTSRPTTPDSSLRLRVARCLAAFWHGRARFDGHQDRSCRSFVAYGLTRQAVWIATGLPCLMSRSARLGAVDRLPSEAHTKGRPVVGRLEFSTDASQPGGSIERRAGRTPTRGHSRRRCRRLLATDGPGRGWHSCPAPNPSP